MRNKPSDRRLNNTINLSWNDNRYHVSIGPNAPDGFTEDGFPYWKDPPRPQEVFAYPPRKDSEDGRRLADYCITLSHALQAGAEPEAIYKSVLKQESGEVASIYGAISRLVLLEKHMNAATVLAKTIYGEARGEPKAGQEAVACVILNRVKRGGWWGNTIETVCLKPQQFSCWNANDPNRKKLEALDENDRVYQTCLNIALDAISGAVVDRTKGATHYHTQFVKPPWSAGKEPCYRVGGHVFFNDVE